MVARIWSKYWKSATQPRKQRKFAKNAPLHVKRKFLTASLSKELRKEHGIRSFTVKTGDSVKITTGQFKNKVGKITKTSIIRSFVHVEGAVIKRTDGTDSLYPIHPSNVEIVKLDLDDKKRKEKFEKVKEANKNGK